ncbi:hypothetical protein AVEN_85003-1 [Araneus ventricosus]|uniref:Ig-like domain-containing protein n=1 Tax=Araneus ventricosus TaxID=182803 RepID=A0A4Y2V0C8_ARAVE|nr:hypothetical protein AVEN_85003-1 [Araneus ventricosus]
MTRRFHCRVNSFECNPTTFCFLLTDPTAVYIEDRANVQEEDGTYKVDLRCVPSGWFAYDSIIWFKDGAPINTETSKQSLHLDLKSPFGMGKVSEFQGYYYCSVALDNPSKHIFSPKLLVKFPESGEYGRSTGGGSFLLETKIETLSIKSKCLMIYGGCINIILSLSPQDETSGGARRPSKDRS